jgi:hypothetical protein
MWTYIACPELPNPPKWLLDQVDLGLCPAINNTGYLQQEPLTNWRGYTGPAALNVRILFNEAYMSWLHENVTTEFENASLNYVVGPPQVCTTTPHRDFTRDYVLIYNVDRGGEQAQLQFWRQIGFEIEREPGAACGNPEQLELLETVPTEHCWYLTNACILHSTDYMERPRVNLQVSFKKGNKFAESIIQRHK